MKRFALLLPLVLFVAPVHALDVSGNVAAEAQWFPRDAQFAGQFDDNLTLSFQPKLRQSWNERNDEITFELFLRADGKDDARQHADIREFKWLHVDDNNEWRIGIDSVFWGVTESQHLVDVINQTDRLEGFDGEDKFGQPMLHFTTIQDWGVFHVFVLPGFREAEFRSTDARLRFRLPVDTSLTRYESSDGDDNIDFALRYSHFIGDIEFGLSLFEGTNREPLLSPGPNGAGQQVLIPFYEQMTQFGLDLQAIVDSWLWKLEYIHRDVNSEAFNAVTAGFEYTFYGIFDSAVDLGTLVEYSWEDRDINPGVFDNDLFAGMRFAFNDAQSSEVLAGVIVDTDKDSTTLRVEASRRIGDSWKLTGEMQVFSSVDRADPLFAFSRDDFLLVELAYYF
jgi:hypothetical protein